MGADVHAFVERFDGQAWIWLDGDLFDRGSHSYAKPWEPFDRSYALFGFLSGVRDHDVPQIHPVRGRPADASPKVREYFGFIYPDDCTHPDRATSWPLGCSCVYNDAGLFGHSWATGAELTGYDFTTPMRCPYAHGDRRPSWSKEPCPHEATHPMNTTVGEYLGGWVDRFHEIAALADDPAHVRVVWAFDN